MHKNVLAPGLPPQTPFGELNYSIPRSLDFGERYEKGKKKGKKEKETVRENKEGKR